MVTTRETETPILVLLCSRRHLSPATAAHGDPNESEATA